MSIENGPRFEQPDDGQDASLEHVLANEIHDLYDRYSSGELTTAQYKAAHAAVPEANKGGKNLDKLPKPTDKSAHVPCVQPVGREADESVDSGWVEQVPKRVYTRLARTGEGYPRRYVSLEGALDMASATATGEPAADSEYHEKLQHVPARLGLEFKLSGFGNKQPIPVLQLFIDGKPDDRIHNGFCLSERHIQELIDGVCSDYQEQSIQTNSAEADQPSHDTSFFAMPAGPAAAGASKSTAAAPFDSDATQRIDTSSLQGAPAAASHRAAGTETETKEPGKRRRGVAILAIAVVALGSGYWAYDRTMTDSANSESVAAAEATSAPTYDEDEDEDEPEDEPTETPTPTETETPEKATGICIDDLSPEQQAGIIANVPIYANGLLAADGSPQDSTIKTLSESMVGSVYITPKEGVKFDSDAIWKLGELPSKPAVVMSLDHAKGYGLEGADDILTPIEAGKLPAAEAAKRLEKVLASARDSGITTIDLGNIGGTSVQGAGKPEQFFASNLKKVNEHLEAYITTVKAAGLDPMVGGWGMGPVTEDPSVHSSEKLTPWEKLKVGDLITAKMAAKAGATIVASAGLVDRADGSSTPLYLNGPFIKAVGGEITTGRIGNPGNSRDVGADASGSLATGATSVTLARGDQSDPQATPANLAKLQKAFESDAKIVDSTKKTAESTLTRNGVECQPADEPDETATAKPTEPSEETAASKPDATGTQTANSSESGDE